MQISIDILNELRELSPLLAGMEKTNIFTVPQGYFEGLADRMLNLCKAEEPSILNDLSKQQPQEVPAGYFDNLADTIMAKIKAAENETAAEELRTLSPALYSIQNENVFEVPAGYFDGLPDMIMAKINNGVNETAAEELKTLSPMLFSIQGVNVFEVPVGYFDSFSDSILVKTNETNETAAEELRTLSPMLYSIQNENVFEVPKGYFAELADDILSKVRPAKVVTMRKRSNSFMKYAVAAVFTGMMALGVFKFTGNQGSTGNRPETVDVDKELANVSDADIVKYLESTGADVKSAVVANSVDDNTLPSQEDFLLDDQTLDKYLNSINVNDLKN
jgi:hypothetical protein